MTLEGYAAIGNSITYGTGSEHYPRRSWADILGIPKIGRPGLAVTTDEPPAPHLPLLDTFAADVLSLGSPPNILLEVGTNDMRFVTVNELVQGYKQLKLVGNDLSTRITFLTIPPRKPFVDSAGREGLPKIATVNNWIRTQRHIDLDPGLRTPNTEYAQLLPSLSSPDRIHPNDAGYLKIANIVLAGI